MCGITGILGDNPDRAILRRMMHRITHRGPDGDGDHVDGRCALGHTRLAIIDVAHGHEPIYDQEDRRAIIYNGEVYNHAGLHKELEERGGTFRTHTDAEVPLHLLADARDAVEVSARLRRLDGMFAFAIWEPDTPGPSGKKGRLLLARDPYGIKPLFFAERNGTFLFASETKSLLAHPAVEPRIDPEAVRQKAVFEYLLPGTTWFEGIQELPPGHWLETDGRETRVHRFHVEHEVPVPTERNKMATKLHALLRNSVEKRLMSEVPLGVVLSGGLDSSLIAALNRELDPDRRVTTFAIAENDRNEDLQKARLVAETIGTDHHEFSFDREDLDRDLAHVVWSNEDIDHETYFFYPLFRQMKPLATVGLCGQGADENFAGYDRYKDITGQVSKLRERTLAAYPDQRDVHQPLFESHYTDLASFLTWDRGAQLTDFQLRLVDRNSMAFGTEIRVPFLDTAVTAFSHALSPDMWIAEDTEKLALRLAAAKTNLPESVVWRPKVPAGRSTAKGLIEAFEADVAASYPDARAAKHPYGHAFRKKAELLMLDLFHEVFVAGHGEKPKDLHWNDLL